MCVSGASNTLTEVLEKFDVISKEEYFGYLKILNDHIESVAHIAVRNVRYLFVKDFA